VHEDCSMLSCTKVLVLIMVVQDSPATAYVGSYCLRYLYYRSAVFRVLRYGGIVYFLQQYCVMGVLL
jgi:hypothetical protein